MHNKVLRYGTFLLLPLSLLNGVEIVSIFSLVDLLVVGLAVGIIVEYHRFEAVRFNATTFSVVVAAMLLLALEVLLVPTAAAPATAMQWTVTRVGNVGVFLLVVLHLETPEDIRYTLRWLVVAVAVTSVVTMLHSAGVLSFGASFAPTRSVFGIEFPFARTLGVPMDYGNFGMFASLAVAYALYEILHAKDMRVIPCLALILFGVAISQSRSTWLAILAVFAVVTTYVVYGTNQFIPSRFNALSGLVIVLSSALVAPAILVELIEINPLTFWHRLNQYRSALEIFVQNPLFGIGRYTFFSNNGVVLHNGFLSVLVSFGVLGFGLFLYVYVQSIRAAIRTLVTAQKNAFLGVMLLAGITGMSIELLFFDGTYAKALWIGLALLNVYNDALTANIREHTEGKAIMAAASGIMIRNNGER